MVLSTVHYMVQDYKKGTKMKLSTVVNTIVLTVIFYFSGLAQVSSPSGYTSNYGFRKYAESATPSADSLNANWDDVDTQIKVAVDSAISTSTSWNRTFNGDVTHSGDFGITEGVTPDARGEFGVTSASPYYPTYYGTSVDTISTRAYARAQATFDATSDYTVTGDWQFGDVNDKSRMTFYPDTLTWQGGETAQNVSALGRYVIGIVGAGGETLTTFTNEQAGDIITLIADPSNQEAITVTNGGDFNLDSSVNFEMNNGDVLTLYCLDVNVWYEVSRSDR